MSTDVRSAARLAANELAVSMSLRWPRRSYYCFAIRSIMIEGRRVLWCATAAGSAVTVTNRALTDLAMHPGGVLLSGRVMASVTPPEWVRATTRTTPLMPDDPADCLEISAIVHSRGTKASPTILEVRIDPLDAGVCISVATRGRPAGWLR